MKRGKRNQNSTETTATNSYYYFPNELLQLISGHVWNQANRLNDLLWWHSTCKQFWNQYLSFDEDKLIAFAEDKRKKNENALKSLFKIQYRHNILVFLDFELMLQMCKIIKEKIISLVDTHFYDSCNPDPSTEIYFMPKWGNWKGVKFNDGILSKHSKSLFKALTPRIVYRYGWQLIFEDSGSKNENKLLFYPWDNNLITPQSVCYIGDSFDMRL